MTPQEMIAEIESLRQQQAAQRKLWLRLGFASNGIGLLLAVVVLVKVAITGNDQPPPMIFIVLTYVFLGIVIITTVRSIARSPR